MANMSTAYGDIELHCKDSKTAEKIIDELNRTLGNEKVDYATIIDKDNLEIKKENDYSVVAKTNFTGYGRWSYQNNVESMGSWLENNEYLTEQPWIMQLKYADYECGCELLYEETDKIVHYAKQPLEDIHVNQVKYEKFDYNPWMMYAVMQYDNESISSEFSLGENYLDNYESAADYNEDRENLLNRSIKSYMKDNPLVSRDKAESEILDALPCLDEIEKIDDYFKEDELEQEEEEEMER